MTTVFVAQLVAEISSPPLTHRQRSVCVFNRLGDFGPLFKELNERVEDGFEPAPHNLKLRGLRCVARAGLGTGDFVIAGE